MSPPLTDAASRSTTSYWPYQSRLGGKYERRKVTGIGRHGTKGRAF